MKTIAFYLPQYHPIPENDEWWGKGFTEWTNVVRARPRFNEHYQPHIPADLGFYDLRTEETRIAQATLAAEYGINGFCYYHYWFNGKMLLERPLNEVLESGKPDFPFCVCWANENWSRRWDGQEREILMEQNYDDYNAETHIEWLSRLFLDNRYIKIKGKPLFLIYRAGDITNIKQKVMDWEKTIQKKGFPGIYLCYIKNFTTGISDQDFLKMGFNAILEFEPRPTQEMLPKQVPGAFVYNYQDFVKKTFKKPKADYIEFPCVFPSWDNSSRKKVDANIIQNLNPELYKIWLKEGLRRVQAYDQEEQFVFINAWNEWAEGCHLEPDLQNGKKFLVATKEALDEFYSGKEDAIDLFNDCRIDNNKWLPFVHQISQFRQVYIWGAGDAGQKTYDNLKKAGIRIAGFIDSNPEKWDSTIQDLPIVGPSIVETSSDRLHSPYIIVASMYSEEITGCLDQQNYRAIVDYIVDERIPKKRIDEGIKFQRNGLDGVCNICGEDKFLYKSNHGTNDYQCIKCSSLSLDRVLIQVLTQELGITAFSGSNFNRLKLLEVSGQHPSSLFLSSIFGYECTYYTPKYFKFLADLAGENFLNSSLTYPDNEFNIVVGQECFNTPFYDDHGYREIFRVLKSEGVFILVLDNYKNESCQLLFDNKSLSELSMFLSSIGFQIGFMQLDYPVHAIGYQQVFVCKKR